VARRIKTHRRQRRLFQPSHADLEHRWRVGGRRDAVDCDFWWL